MECESSQRLLDRAFRGQKMETDQQIYTCHLRAGLLRELSASLDLPLGFGLRPWLFGFRYLKAWFSGLHSEARRSPDLGRCQSLYCGFLSRQLACFPALEFVAGE